MAGRVKTRPAGSSRPAFPGSQVQQTCYSSCFTVARLLHLTALLRCSRPATAAALLTVDCKCSRPATAAAALARDSLLSTQV